MEPPKNPNQVDPNTSSPVVPDAVQQDENSQYFNPMQVSVASGGVPGGIQIQPLKPKRSTGLKLLIAYFLAGLGFSILGTIGIIMISVSDPLAGAGAGWGLLITIPGILFSLASLIIIFIAEWFVNRSNTRRSMGQTNSSGTINTDSNSSDNGKGIMRFAIVYGAIVLLYTGYQVSHTIMIGLGYSDFGNGLTEGLLPIAIALLLGVAGLVGLVMVIMSHALAGKRKLIAIALFVSPLLASYVHSGVISTFLSGSSGSSPTRAANQIERLSFKPLLPPLDFVGQYNTKLKYVSVHDDEFDISFGKVTEDSSETYLYMSQVNVDKRDKVQRQVATCQGSSYHFTTAGGVEVATVIQETAGGDTAGQFCFNRDGVSIYLSLPNDDVLKDEKAVGEFVDSLRQISPKEFTAYYDK